MRLLRPHRRTPRLPRHANRNRRTRLRRPAARRRLRRGRPRRRGLRHRHRRIERLAAARATSRTSPPSQLASTRRPPHRDRRPGRSERLRRDPDLRTDPARQPARARPELRHRLDPDDRRGAPRRSAGRARVDDLPGHHARGAPADARARRASRPARTSISPTRPSASTRAAPTTRSRRRRRSSAASPRPASSAPPRSTSEICDEVVRVSSPEAAELTKLLENIFRSVNIALVNELAQLTDRLGIDIWEVIDAASTKPFGFMRFEPGPGMGGHCLPVDPFYLAYKARQSRLLHRVRRARRQDQPVATRSSASPRSAARSTTRASRVKGSQGPDPRRLLQGRRRRHSASAPALKIIKHLHELGADVSYHDPLVPELPELGLESVELEPAPGTPTPSRSSPPTPASTTRRSVARRRWSSTSAGSPAASTPSNVVRL